ncbi:uncharacterized protein VTP21DRAFT_10175 [Calcarisporiella thermophila]|uniref:uncharacterized protein n=1 Tax=Calcarisporiella thermophila TaxID=911321 RepID=UPI0037449FCC
MSDPMSSSTSPPAKSRPKTSPIDPNSMREDELLLRLVTHMNELHRHMEQLETTVGTIPRDLESALSSRSPPAGNKASMQMVKSPRIAQHQPPNPRHAARRLAAGMTPGQLRFQLHLRTAGDLFNLMQRHFSSDIDVRSNLHMPTPHKCAATKADIVVQGTFERHSIQGMLQSSSVVWEGVGRGPVRRHVVQHLFHQYATSCFFLYQPLDRAQLLERFYRDELDPAFVYSAVGWAAHHSYRFHRLPFARQLPLVAATCFEEARSALEGGFDEPSEQRVIAFLNLSEHLLLQAQYPKAHFYLELAIRMAQELGMHLEGNKENTLQREKHKRIWWGLCLADMCLAVYGVKTPVIHYAAIKNAAIPIPLPSEDEGSQRTMRYVVENARALSELFELPQVDLSSPDPEVLDSLMRATVVFKQYHTPLRSRWINEGPPWEDISCAANFLRSGASSGCGFSRFTRPRALTPR